MIPTPDECWEAEFQVLWHVHGGSGINMTRDEYLELTIAQRDWLLERIAKQREDEANEIRRSAKG